MSADSVRSRPSPRTTSDASSRWSFRAYSEARLSDLVNSLRAALAASSAAATSATFVIAAQRLDVRARRVELLRDSCYRAIGRLPGDGVAQLRSAQIEHSSFRDPRRRIKGPGVERTGLGGGVTLPEEECCGGNCNEEQTEQNQASHTTLHETLL